MRLCVCVSLCVRLCVCVCVCVRACVCVCEDSNVVVYARARERETEVVILHAAGQLGRCFRARADGDEARARCSATTTSTGVHAREGAFVLRR